MIFKFSCPHCGQHISTDSGDCGLASECPTCNQPIVVPKFQPPSPPPPTPPRPPAPRRAVSTTTALIFVLLVGIYAWHSFAATRNANTSTTRANAEREAGAALARSAAEAKKKQENEAVKKALKELRKIHSATSAGMIFSDYSRRVADAKVEVDSELSDVADGDLKDSLQHIMATYSAAAEFWSLGVQRGKLFDLTASELDYYREFIPHIERDTGLSYLNVFWVSAREQLDNVEVNLKAQ